MDETLNFAPCGYVSITNDGNIKIVNHTFVKMLGYEVKDLINHHIESLMSIANKFLFHTYFYPFIELNGEVNELNLTLRTKEGKDFPMLLNGIRCEREGSIYIDCIFVQMNKRMEYEKEIRSIKKKLENTLKEKDEVVERLLISHQDNEKKQEELLRLNTELKKMSMTDVLTGLNNRRYFQETLEESIKWSKHHHIPFSLLILDVDFFKKINDSFGHTIGDETLKGLAQIFQSLFVNNEVIARYGGEEFVVIVPKANEKEIIAISEMVRETVAKHKIGDLHVTVSVGATTFIQGDSFETILNRADQALYHSKNNGRNCVAHSMHLPV